MLHANDISIEKLEFWKLLACTFKGNAQASSLNVLLQALGLGGIQLWFFFPALVLVYLCLEQIVHVVKWPK